MANSDNGFAIFNRLADSIGRAYGWKGLDTEPDSPSVTADLLVETARHSSAHLPGIARPGRSGIGAIRAIGPRTASATAC